MGNISIVIGSWGSYNECNERALGSNWLDLFRTEYGRREKPLSPRFQAVARYTH